MTAFSIFPELATITTEENVVLHFKEGKPIMYQFEQPVEHPEFLGYYYIPHALNFCIHPDDNNVIKIDTGELRNIYWSHGSHVDCSYPATTMNGRSLTIHRLKLLTFDICPGYPQDWHCNHIDGIKYNNALDNLEWVTPRRNSYHAFENNLNVQAKPVAVELWNYQTDEKLSFPSKESAALHLGVWRSKVDHRVERPNNIRYKDGWRIKKKDDEWLSLNDRFNVSIHDREVKALNVRNNEIRVFPTLALAASATNCNRSTVFNHCKEKSTSPNNGFVFRYIDDNFPSYTDLQYRLFEKSGYVGRQSSGVVLYNKDGSIYALDIIPRIMELLGFITKDGLLKPIRNDGKVRGMRAEFIDRNGV